jgi:gliding motility-associated-like protein
VILTVTSVNDAPVANADSATVAEDGSVVIDVTANDTDVDGSIDPTTVIITTPPTNGTVTVDPVTGKVTYTPDADYYGADNFEYSVKDNDGLVSNPATVSLTVTSVNDAPVANVDSETVAEDGSVVIDVTANDTDVDGSIDPTTVVISTPPTNGTVTVDPVTGKVTYTPDADYYGADNFEYSVKDNDGLVSNPATVSLTVTSVNDAPVANVDSETVAEDGSVVIDVTANDTDVDGSIDITTVVITTPPTNGTVTVDAVTGKVTYTPDADYNGADSFEYTVKDNDGLVSNPATVILTVTSVNDAPVANADSATVAEDGSVVIDVTANDTDVDGRIDPTTVVITTPPSNGSVTVDAVTGEVTYTPNPDFNGEDSFTYTISDGNGGTATATVTITVNPINDAPLANEDIASVDEDNAITVSVLNNDSDVDGDDFTVVSTTVPENGSVVINEDGTITYTPNPDFNGEDSFTYTISDGNGGTDTAKVTITVNAVNDAPIAVDVEATTDEDNAVIVSVLDNDTDVDGDGLTVVSTTDPENGSVVINEDGTITYTPNPDFNGEDSFTYTISDGNGGTATAIVTVTINPVDDQLDPPIIGEVIQPTCENPTGTISVETLEGLTYSINGGNYQESGVFSNLEPDTYTVTARNGATLTSEVTSVTLNEPIATDIETLTGVSQCYDGGSYDLFNLLVGEFDRTGTWENPNSTGALDRNMLDLDSFENDLGTYTFNYVLSGNCPSTTAVELTIDDSCVVLACGLDDIKKSISKAVTPNGDGFNDFFTVNLDTECGFSFNLKIFNRWGNEIFESMNYQNNWDGYSNKSISGSNQLPSGTYYYILEINGSNLQPIQGYIYLGTK